MARAPAIDRPRRVGGCARAYAGFPEVVYLYALLIVAWVAVRAAAMPIAQATSFLVSLAATALLSLVTAAPLLLAFVDFLPEAIVGFHIGDAFPQPALLPTSFLLTFLPWVYGPIAAAPVPAAAASWNGMGGYLCLMPALLAIAGLYCGRRRAICWLMAAWSLVSIAASHGAPVLHPLFLSVPLVKLTLFFRYLDAGWILCCVVLAAIFLDQLPSMAPEQRRRTRRVALAVMGAVLALALLLAGPTLASLWAIPASRRYEVAYLLIGIIIVFFFAATRSRRLLITLAVGEATVTFLFPLASFASAHRLDWPLIAFLCEHVGLQRMAVGMTAAVNPNYAAGDRFDVACAAPSRLIRREVWMQGWTARVNDAPAPVQLEDDTFQAVELPQGSSTVTFRYDPTGVRASAWGALAAVVLALAFLATPMTRRLPRAARS